MSPGKIILRVENHVTTIDGRLPSDLYKKLKKVLGYRPENVFWMIRNTLEKGKDEYGGGNKSRSEEWKKDWDGTISTVCWNQQTCRCNVKKHGTHFPSGLLSKAKSFLTEHGVAFEVVDARSKVPTTTNYSMSPEFEYRDYQQEISEKVTKIDRGIIKVATGGGKSSIACDIIHRIGVSPTVFYVPSVDLLHQAKTEIEKFVRYLGEPVEVGMVGGGKTDIRDITVMTIQTAVRALGGVWVKFDDEDFAADETDIGSKKDEVRELIRGCRLMICDEIQHWAAETCQIIADNSWGCQYRYGLSVGPDSSIELKGWIYGEGATSTIENMWSDVDELSDLHQLLEGSYEIIDISDLGISSRGWDDARGVFCWKPVKKIIRHTCVTPSRTISFRGKNSLMVTDDHSVYYLPRNENVDCSSFKCAVSEEIKRGDLLIADNGNEWGGVQKSNFDIFQTIHETYHNPSKVRVEVNLEGLSHKDLGMSYQRFYQILRRRSGIPLSTYMSYSSILSRPTKIYTEGANRISISPDLSLRSMAYLIGFFLGDGWFDGNRIAFAVESSKLDFFLKKISEIDGIVVRPSVRKMQGDSYEVKISSALLVCLLKRMLGKKFCFEKRIPSEVIFEWDMHSKMRLINGMMDSDGCSKKKDRGNKSEGRFTTTSRNMADDLQVLLRSLGVASSLSVRKPALGGKIGDRVIVGRFACYQVIFSVNALLGFNKGRNGNAKKFTKIACNEYKVCGVDPVPHDDYVYDLEMDGHPSFVANGILVHNSATPWRDKGDDILIDGHFGRCIADISASKLIRAGWLVKPTIYFTAINNLKGASHQTYNNIYKAGIVENEFRNNRIIQLANLFRERGRNILILVKQISHGKLLESLLPESTFLYGGTAKRKRQRHLELMRAGERPLTIASVIFDEGIDVRPLDALIQAGSGKSPTRALQRVGRILRPFKGKEDAIVVDFFDHCKYLRDHSRRRLEIYRTEEEFEILGKQDED